jgi:glycosyltransferase involved in cell wall biosynthesis
MKPRRLLYLAFFYPPSRASGVYRALATSKLFAQAGWEVDVVTVDECFLEDELGATDPSLLADIPDTSTVIRVPFTFSRHGEFPFTSTRVVAATFPSIYLRMRTRRGRGVAFPDRYETWIQPVLEEVQTRDLARFDYILATGNPFSSFEVARQLSEASGVPFGVDYRDPWTFDARTGRDTGDTASTRAEKRILDTAAACFHVNQAIAQAYERKYPTTASKHVVAMNGFDANSLGEVHLPSRSGPIRFGILGTVTERWPLDSLFDGWAMAQPTLPPGSEMLLAGYLGFFDRSSEVIDSFLPHSLEGFRYLGPINKREAGAFNGSLDVVVAPVPDGAMVTGSKILEALALGIPVVCIQSRGGGARAILDGHPYAFGAEPEKASVAQALESAVKVARAMATDSPSAVRASMAKYERLKALTPILESAESLTAGPGWK